ncbi:hypothetical protein O181_074628 [Austropuccinia psidii MF-1]|uniref:F-box domain-containing protein n=1 Tax=Austropuccinia psidii MF-1 TaxID=1389203 RepID=A0A9Q3FBE0_9BASI|nr:hypothetical protein [Austropuccinia psidii MF-1]
MSQNNLHLLQLHTNRKSSPSTSSTSSINFINHQSTSNLNSNSNSNSNDFLIHSQNNFNKTPTTPSNLNQTNSNSSIIHQSNSPLPHLPPPCRAISPPTPAPSPQPDSINQILNSNQLIKNKSSNQNLNLIDLDNPISLLDSFNSLSLSNRSKFLNLLLSNLNLNELTSLSGKILPRLKRDFLRELPIEISLHILSFVDDPKTLMRAGMVSRFWRSLVSDETTWKGMCWKRGFNNTYHPFITPLNLNQRMEKERLGRVASYRASLKETNRKNKSIYHQNHSIQSSQSLNPSNHSINSYNPNIKSINQQIPSQNFISSTSLGILPQSIHTGLGLGTNPSIDLSSTTISITHQNQNQNQFFNNSFSNSSSNFGLSVVEPSEDQISIPYHSNLLPPQNSNMISRRNSFNDMFTSPRLDSSSSAGKLISESFQSSSSSKMNSSNLINRSSSRQNDSSNLQSSSNSSNIKQPYKIVNAYSPEPGMVPPTNATSSKRIRPRSMPLIGLSLNLSRSISAFADLTLDSPSNDLKGPSSENQINLTTQAITHLPDHLQLANQSTPTTANLSDLPQTASTIEEFDYSPRTPFSYKTYFKRAYLTESNWLRGPGELIAVQTSQNNDGHEWVVTSLGFDDDWIVVGMATSKIHVFSAHTGEFLRTLTGHELGVWCLALISKGGFRDPRDGPTQNQKGKEPEVDHDHNFQSNDNLQAISSLSLTPEWVSSNYGPSAHPHGANMIRAKAGLGMSFVKRDRQNSHQNTLHGHLQPAADIGSIFQPANGTSEEQSSSQEWSSTFSNHQSFQAQSVLPRPIINSFDTFGLSSDLRQAVGLNSHSHATNTGRSSVRMTHSSHDPRRSRRPSSFSSFMTSSQPYHTHTDNHNFRTHNHSAQNGANGVLGGMGLGAGGPSSGNLQQASACGIARGWGQKESLVVSGGCDRDVRVWDVATGRCKFVLHGHSSTIRCLKVLDGRPIAVSGSRDASLRVWDIEKGVQKHILVGHTSSVRAIEVHGNRAVSGSYDTTCRLWDVDTGECLKVLRGHYHQIYAVAFDGTRIASGSMDSTVCIWSSQTGELLALLQGHTALVGQVQINGQSNMLVTGGSDGRVVIFNLESFECVHRLCAHDNSVTCLQFDDRFVVTGGNDGRVKLWDFKTGAFIRELAEPCEAVWRITLRDDKAILLCKRDGKTVMEVISFKPTMD